LRNALTGADTMIYGGSMLSPTATAAEVQQVNVGLAAHTPAVSQSNRKKFSLNIDQLNITWFLQWCIFISSSQNLLWSLNENVCSFLLIA
jgi:hypothetical protein